MDGAGAERVKAAVAETDAKASVEAAGSALTVTPSSATADRIARTIASAAGDALTRLTIDEPTLERVYLNLLDRDNRARAQGDAA